LTMATSGAPLAVTATVDRVDHRGGRDDHDLRLGSLRWPDRFKGRCTVSRCSNSGH
jgi:hypothetical protein